MVIVRTGTLEAHEGKLREGEREGKREKKV